MLRFSPKSRICIPYPILACKVRPGQAVAERAAGGTGNLGNPAASFLALAHGEHFPHRTGCLSRAKWRCGIAIRLLLPRRLWRWSRRRDDRRSNTLQGGRVLIRFAVAGSRSCETIRHVSDSLPGTPISNRTQVAARRARSRTSQNQLQRRPCASGQGRILPVQFKGNSHSGRPLPASVRQELRQSNRSAPSRRRHRFGRGWSRAGGRSAVPVDELGWTPFLRPSPV